MLWDENKWIQSKLARFPLMFSGTCAKKLHEVISSKKVNKQVLGILGKISKFTVNRGTV